MDESVHRDDIASLVADTGRFPSTPVRACFRKPGNTRFDVSTVGFATWQVGGGRWKAKSENECIALFREAQERGVNIFDAAAVHGQYVDEHEQLQRRSQELLGAAFQDCRDRVFSCVKIGQYYELSHRCSFEASRLAGQVTQSLRRLRTSVLDVCLLHAPSLADVKRGAAIGVLRALPARAHVCAIGYDFENEPEHVQAALQQRFDVIMLQHNLLDYQCAELLSEAREHGTGVLVSAPFKRGYLTGRFRYLEDIPAEDDYWRWSVHHNAGKVANTLERVKWTPDL